MSILVLKDPIAARHQLQIWIGARVVKLLGFDKGGAFFFPVRMPKKHSSGIGFLDQKLNALWTKRCEGLLKDEMNNLSRCAGENRRTVDRLDGVTAESLGIDGSQIFTIKGLSDDLQPSQQLTVEIKSSDGKTRYFPDTTCDRTDPLFIQHQPVIPGVVGILVISRTSCHAAAGESSGPGQQQ